MPQPVTSVSWATTEVTEVVNIGGNNLIVTNKVEPTASYLNAGVLAREPFPRPYVNYILNSHGQWIEYLNEGDTGDFKLVASSTTAAGMTDRFGGSWVDHGTDSFAGQTLRLFEKTS